MKGPREEVHTAVHFNTPEKYRGLTCTLRFRLSTDDWTVNVGFNYSKPAKSDIYRLNGCMNDAHTWASSLARGIKAGIITPEKGGMADWEHVDMSEGNKTEPYMRAAPALSCVLGEYSFEMINGNGQHDRCKA